MQGENHEMIKLAANSLDYQPIVFDYMPFSNDLAMFITAVSFQFIFVSYAFTSFSISTAVSTFRRNDNGSSYFSPSPRFLATDTG